MPASALVFMSYHNRNHSDLVLACLTSDEEAWKEFKARYNEVISVAVFRTARRCGDISKSLLEDLISEVFVKIFTNKFALLRNFQFRTANAIFGFLKVVATNVVLDYFRHIRSQKYGTEVPIDEVYPAPDPPVPSRTGPDDIERSVLIREVDEALWQVTGPEGERDRTIFWLHHRQGFTAEEIAALEFVNIGTKGVESALHRLKIAVQERLTEKAVCAAAEQEK